MTFDDGFVTIYKLENKAEKGDMPKNSLVFKLTTYFNYEKVGIQRYFTALKNNTRIDEVINVDFDKRIMVNDIAVIDYEKYEIVMNQRVHDEDGLLISKLSLQRL